MECTVLRDFLLDLTLIGQIELKWVSDCVQHTPILRTPQFAPFRFVPPLTMQCSSLCDCLIGSRTALRNKHACTHACTHLNAHSRFRVKRLFEKFLSALADTASKTLDKTTLSQITIAQLMRKAATVRNIQVTLRHSKRTENGRSTDGAVH